MILITKIFRAILRIHQFEYVKGIDMEASDFTHNPTIEEIHSMVVKFKEKHPVESVFPITVIIHEMYLA